VTTKRALQHSAVKDRQAWDVPDLDIDNDFQRPRGRLQSSQFLNASRTGAVLIYFLKPGQSLARDFFKATSARLNTASAGL
jgi:hypothetical protein